MDTLIDANLHFLGQAAELLDRLEDGCYARCEEGFYNSSIGGHLRHCLEHYESFTGGLAEGRIDYDARLRDVRVETETGAAQERIDRLVEELKQLRDKGDLDVDASLEVKMDCGEDRPEGCEAGVPWQASTVGRELQFLVSHTVHHFAMIKGLCFSSDTEIATTFGVAPSTLRHRESLAQA